MSIEGLQGGFALDSAAVGPVPTLVQNRELEGLSAEQRQLVERATESAVFAFSATSQVIAAGEKLAKDETAKAQADESERYEVVGGRIETDHEAAKAAADTEHGAIVRAAKEKRRVYGNEVEEWRQKQIAEINRIAAKNLGIADNTLNGQLAAAAVGHEASVRAADAEYATRVTTNEQIHHDTQQALDEHKTRNEAFYTFCDNAIRLLGEQVHSTQQEFVTAAGRLEHVKELVRHKRAELGPINENIEALLADIEAAQRDLAGGKKSHETLSRDNLKAREAHEERLLELQTSDLNAEDINNIYKMNEEYSEVANAFGDMLRDASGKIRGATDRIVTGSQKLEGLRERHEAIVKTLAGDTSTMGAHQQLQLLEQIVQDGGRKLAELGAQLEALEGLVREHAPLSHFREVLGDELVEIARSMPRRPEQPELPTTGTAAELPEYTQGGVKLEISDPRLEASAPGTLLRPSVNITISKTDIAG